MTTLQEEAMNLVGLLPNPQRYSEKLNQLLAAKAEAETAVANLKLQQIATAEAMTSKLQAQENLLGMLQGQTDEIEAARAAAAAKMAAAETDLSHRASELEAAKVAHAAEVARSVDMFKEREAELKQRQSALDADFHRRLEDLRGVENKLRDHHSVLRDIVTETRARIAAAS
jgi:predicted component of type VI protein secretion system